MKIGYYVNQFDVLMLDYVIDETKTYLGFIEEEDLVKLEEKKPKDATLCVDSENRLYWGEVKKHKRSENEEWLSISIEQRQDKSFLYQHLRFKFIDDDWRNGIDEERPLNDEGLTCDELRTKILQWHFDDKEHQTRAEELEKELVQAKEYIRSKNKSF